MYKLLHCKCGHAMKAHALNFGRIRLHCLVKGCSCERHQLCSCGRDTNMGQESAHPESESAGSGAPEG